MGPKGQVVIPKPIRDRLGLRPGDSVIFVEQEGGVRVERFDDIRRLAGLLADAPFDVTRVLEEDRRAARAREEREITEWRSGRSGRSSPPS